MSSPAHEKLDAMTHMVKLSRIVETAATPMFQKGLGLAGLGSLAKSLNTNAKAEMPKLGGNLPKLASSGSSFAEALIQKVADGADPRDVLREADLEASSEIVSPSGRPLDTSMIRPGMHIGITGPVHNGYHTVDQIGDGLIKMKCEDGHDVTIPLSDLQNHDVVHATANY